jgi:hypothetical protein
MNKTSEELKPSRRQFLKTGMAGIAGSTVPQMGFTGQVPAGPETELFRLDQELNRPVLRKEMFPVPVIVDRLELLHYRGNFICRVTSRDGAEGVSVSNNAQRHSLYPVFVNRLQPFFLGKDARDWEKLMDEVYVFQSNYK